MSSRAASSSRSKISIGNSSATSVATTKWPNPLSGLTPKPIGAFAPPRNQCNAALVDYLRRGGEAGCNPHPLFDTTFYRSQNPDVAQAGIDPLLHYLASGALEGRDPHLLFDTDWYLQQNPDLAASGVNPLVDYLCRGRELGCNPHPPFDTTFYRSQTPTLH